MSRFFPTIFLAIAVLIIAVSCARQGTGDPRNEKTGLAHSASININTASAEELELLPNIGEKLASRIVEYRREHGSFRRPEELLLIQGISDRKFREIRNLIAIE